MNNLDTAIRIIGGQSALAKSINDWIDANNSQLKKIKQQNVWKWINSASGIPTVPPEYRLPIEQITHGKVTAFDLSHDIYGQQKQSV